MIRPSRDAARRLGGRERGRQLLVFSLALALATLTAACGGGSGSPPPPPPPPVTVTVAPATPSVVLGATQQFTPTVTGSSNTAVTWSVNGVTGGTAQAGTIDVNGLYRAPAILPSPATVTIRATSVASPSSSGTATATVTSDVLVNITAPAPNSSVELGATQQITKSITSAGQPDQNVIWSVSGNGCTGSACGTISTAGVFTAPAILPPTANRDVTVTATSVADSSKSATLTLHIIASFGFAITGPASGSIDNALSFKFVPNFTPVPGSAPSPSVSWSVSGPVGGCTGTACGTIDQAGLYTAPNLAPAPPSVTITGTPLADPSKAHSVTVTINTVVVVAISPTTLNIEIEAQQQFTANVGGTTNQAVTWSISGPGCTNPGNPCGVLSNLGPVLGSVPVIYTAPIMIPSGPIGPVTVTATSAQDVTKSAGVTPTFFSTIQPSLLPSGATRALNHRQSLDAVLVRTSTGTAPVGNAVDWTVIDNLGNRVPGGNATVGFICQRAADGMPCSQTGTTPSGPPAAPFQVDYLAPDAAHGVPASGAVTIEMRSQADPSKFITSVVTVIANVIVNVSPSQSTLPINGTQQFTASVVGALNQSVTWSVSGTSCSLAPCGAISPTGLYTAPGTAPANATDTVIATSVDDPLRSGSGTLTIASGAFIQKILPASITALGASSTDFTLKVQGSQFVQGAAGTGSTILFNTNALTTTCSTSSQCTATISASSVTAAGDYGVQIRNPDNSTSNQVALKVLDPATQQKDFDHAPSVTLTVGNPDSTGNDILVVEPTSAGSGAASYNMDLLGIVSGNTCSLHGAGMTLTRPTSGTLDITICVKHNSTNGGDLSATDTFTISGPSPPDITIVNVANFGAGGGTVQITLRIGSASQTGPRTLFAENKNREKAALVGGIEVK